MAKPLVYARLRQWEYQQFDVKHVKHTNIPHVNRRNAEKSTEEDDGSTQHGGQSTHVPSDESKQKSSTTTVDEKVAAADFDNAAERVDIEAVPTSMNAVTGSSGISEETGANISASVSSVAEPLQQTKPAQHEDKPNDKALLNDAAGEGSIALDIDSTLHSSESNTDIARNISAATFVDTSPTGQDAGKVAPEEAVGGSNEKQTTPTAPEPPIPATATNEPVPGCENVHQVATRPAAVDITEQCRDQPISSVNIQAEPQAPSKLDIADDNEAAMSAAVNKKTKTKGKRVTLDVPPTSDEKTPQRKTSKVSNASRSRLSRSKSKGKPGKKQEMKKVAASVDYKKSCTSEKGSTGTAPANHDDVAVAIDEQNVDFEIEKNPSDGPNPCEGVEPPTVESESKREQACTDDSTQRENVESLDEEASPGEVEALGPKVYNKKAEACEEKTTRPKKTDEVENLGDVEDPKKVDGYKEVEDPKEIYDCKEVIGPKEVEPPEKTEDTEKAIDLEKLESPEKIDDIEKAIDPEEGEIPEKENDAKEAGDFEKVEISEEIDNTEEAIDPKEAEILQKMVDAEEAIESKGVVDLKDVEYHQEVDGPRGMNDFEKMNKPKDAGDLRAVGALKALVDPPEGMEAEIRLQIEAEDAKSNKDHSEVEENGGIGETEASQNHEIPKQQEATTQEVIAGEGKAPQEAVHLEDDDAIENGAATSLTDIGASSAEVMCGKDNTPSPTEPEAVALEYGEERREEETTNEHDMSEKDQEARQGAIGKEQEERREAEEASEVEESMLFTKTSATDDKAELPAEEIRTEVTQAREDQHETTDQGIGGRKEDEIANEDIDSDAEPKADFRHPSQFTVSDSIQLSAETDSQRNRSADLDTAHVENEGAKLSQRTGSVVDAEEHNNDTAFQDAIDEAPNAEFAAVEDSLNSLPNFLSDGQDPTNKHMETAADHDTRDVDKVTTDVTNEITSSNDVPDHTAQRPSGSTTEASERNDDLTSNTHLEAASVPFETTRITSSTGDLQDSVYIAEAASEATPEIQLGKISEGPDAIESWIDSSNDTREKASNGELGFIEDTDDGHNATNCDEVRGGDFLDTSTTTVDRKDFTPLKEAGANGKPVNEHRDQIDGRILTKSEYSDAIGISQIVGGISQCTESEPGTCKEPAVVSAPTAEIPTLFTEVESASSRSNALGDLRVEPEQPHIDSTPNTGTSVDGPEGFATFELRALDEPGEISLLEESVKPPDNDKIEHADELLAKASPESKHCADPFQSNNAVRTDSILGNDTPLPSKAIPTFTRESITVHRSETPQAPTTSRAHRDCSVNKQDDSGNTDAAVNETLENTVDASTITTGSVMHCEVSESPQKHSTDQRGYEGHTRRGDTPSHNTGLGDVIHHNLGLDVDSKLDKIWQSEVDQNETGFPAPSAIPVLPPSEKRRRHRHHSGWEREHHGSKSSSKKSDEATVSRVDHNHRHNRGMTEERNMPSSRKPASKHPSTSKVANNKSTGKSGRLSPRVVEDTGRATARTYRRTIDEEGRNVKSVSLGQKANSGVFFALWDSTKSSHPQARRSHTSKSIQGRDDRGDRIITARKVRHQKSRDATISNTSDLDAGHDAIKDNGETTRSKQRVEKRRKHVQERKDSEEGERVRRTRGERHSTQSELETTLLERLDNNDSATDETRRHRHRHRHRQPAEPTKGSFASKAIGGLKKLFTKSI